MLSLRKRPQGVPMLYDVFEDVFNQTFPSTNIFKGSTVPSVNITESDKMFKLEFAAPGFAKKDFGIDIEKEFLTISGKKEERTESANHTINRKEFYYGSFKRTFSIPENVDTNRIEAVYENGILNILLPKREVKAEDSVKKIEIK